MVYVLLPLLRLGPVAYGALVALILLESRVLLGGDAIDPLDPHVPLAQLPLLDFRSPARSTTWSRVGDGPSE